MCVRVCLQLLRLFGCVSECLQQRCCHTSKKGFLDLPVVLSVCMCFLMMQHAELSQPPY